MDEWILVLAVKQCVCPPTIPHLHGQVAPCWRWGLILAPWALTHWETNVWPGQVLPWQGVEVIQRLVWHPDVCSGVLWLNHWPTLSAAHDGLYPGPPWLDLDLILTRTSPKNPSCPLCQHQFLQNFLKSMLYSGLHLNYFKFEKKRSLYPYCIETPRHTVC